MLTGGSNRGALGFEEGFSLAAMCEDSRGDGHRDPARPWIAGSSMCYTKAFWRQNPFPDINIGEDNFFVGQCRGNKLLVLEDHTFMVAIIHPGNASPKQTRGRWWRPVPLSQVRAVMGTDLDACHQACFQAP